MSLWILTTPCFHATIDAFVQSNPLLDPKVQQLWFLQNVTWFQGESRASLVIAVISSDTELELVPI